MVIFFGKQQDTTKIDAVVENVLVTVPNPKEHSKIKKKKTLLCQQIVHIFRKEVFLFI